MQPNLRARADAIYPGGPDRPCPRGRSSVAFDASERLGSRDVGIFGAGPHRPTHSLSTHQDGGRPSPCKTRFRRGGYPFAGWDLHPRGPLDEFQKDLDGLPSPRHCISWSLPPAYPPLATVDALLERRLCRRHAVLGEARRGPPRPPSMIQRRLCRRHPGGGSEGGRSPPPRTLRSPRAGRSGPGCPATRARAGPARARAPCAAAAGHGPRGPARGGS